MTGPCHMSSKSLQGSAGVLPWLLSWACRANTIDFCSALAPLVVPVQNIFFLTAHFFTLLVPIALQPGQAFVLGRLSLGSISQRYGSANPDPDSAPNCHGSPTLLRSNINM
jgi:hypothetical protein